MAWKISHLPLVKSQLPPFSPKAGSAGQSTVDKMVQFTVCEEMGDNDEGVRRGQNSPCLRGLHFVEVCAETIDEAASATATAVMVLENIVVDLGYQ